MATIPTQTDVSENSPPMHFFNAKTDFSVLPGYHVVDDLSSPCFVRTVLGAKNSDEARGLA